MVLLFCLSSALYGFGWRDYTRDIGDGYAIVHCNSMQHYISSEAGEDIDPFNYEDVGPIKQYQVTPKYIFAEYYGRISEDRVHPSKAYFFIIDKEKHANFGPFLEAEFLERPEVVALGTLKWKKPKNPRVWVPLLGNLYFLVLLFGIFYMHFYPITLPLTVLFLVFCVIFFRKVQVSWKK